MSALEIVLLALGGNALLLVVLGFLAKSLMSQLLAKDLERFKASLSQASCSAMEELKHQLNLTAHEHSVRFSRLHDRQAQVVEEVYARLLNLEDASAVFSLVSDNMPADLVEPALRKAEAAQTDLRLHLRRHEIYLPSSLSGILAAMLSQVDGLLDNCGRNVMSRKWSPGDPEALFPEAAEAWSRVNSYLEDEAPLIRESLKVEFRKLLGTEAIDG